MTINPELATTLIRNRRSIYPKQFTGAPIDDQVIEDLLENANWAPSHKLTQPWRFKVFKGKGIEQLAKFQSELYKKVSIQNNNFSEESFEKLQSKPRLCSHIISIGMKRHEIIPEIEEIASVSCAVQNMYLTASAYQIGCYWTTGGITFYEEAKEFFGLERNDRLMGFLYLGNYNGKWPSGKRQSIQDKIEWVDH